MDLSLIVPIYNGAEFIQNLGRNILNIHQAIGSVEFILVNDGSSDSTAKNLTAFVAENPQIDCQIIHQENGGVSNARNNALKVAHGQYIMFMDHDDNIDADKFSQLFTQLKDEQVDLLHFNVRSQYPTHDKAVDINDFINDYPFVSYVWSYVYKCELIEQKQLSFTEGMKYLEDGLFVLDYMLGCKTILASNAEVYDYVDNPASAMRSSRTAEQNKKYLDDVGLAVREYTRIIQNGQAVVRDRLLEIRDSFQFIYMVQMLKLSLSKTEVFQRLKDVNYDFKMAHYPSKFNNRRPVRWLCKLFRSKALLGLVVDTQAFKHLRRFIG